MSRHLFFCVLLPLLLIGCTCGLACADSTVRRKNGVDLFVPKETKIPEELGKTEPKKDVEHFSTPFLVAADGVMVAFAEARFPAKENHLNVGVAARYIGTQERDWAQKATEDKGNNWATQLAIASRELEKKKDDFFTSASLSVAKGKKIYLLAVRSMWRTKTGRDTDAEVEVSLELAVGEVTDGKSKTTDKAIQWKKLEEASTQLNQQVKSQSLTLSPSGGFPFLTKDGRIVFVMGVRNHKDRTVAAIIHSTGKEGDTEWELSHVKTDDDCSSFSFLEWEGKLMMIPTFCKGGYNSGGRIKESDDMGKTWTNVNGSFSRLLNKLKSKRDFTTVTIDNRTVLLFTQTNPGGVEDRKYDIHLEFTDGHRVHDIGPIVADDRSVFPGGLLYTNGELVFLYYQNGETTDRIIFTRLSDELKTIKSVLNTWAERDAYFSRPCEETAAEGAPVGTLCLTPMPTDGIVGFFSNHASKDTWQDEYLYLNATVKGGTKVGNGFVFNGTNAGARWAVRHQGFANMHYSLTHGATVVATVTIHEVLQDDTPLLTFGGVWQKGRLGLWYGGNEWKVKSESDGGETHAGGSMTNESYRVALVLRDGNISAYVDGNPVGEPLQLSEHQGGLHSIKHVLIGSYKEDSVKDNIPRPYGLLDNDVKDTVSYVTVTNVLLYNRPLSDAELKTLGERTVQKPKSGNTGGSNQQLSGGDGSNQQGTVDAHKKDSAQKLTGLGDSSVHVPAVGVLLFVLSLWGISVYC